jgi:pre-mRNA-splicing factor SYF1
VDEKGVEINAKSDASAAHDRDLHTVTGRNRLVPGCPSPFDSANPFEESFKGVELFTFPVSFQIWNIYFAKFVKRYGGTKIERARDLIEQALDMCPPKSCRPFFLMYVKLEEEHGLAKRATAIYDRATQVVTDEDKFEVCLFSLSLMLTQIVPEPDRCLIYILPKPLRTMACPRHERSTGRGWRRE